MLAIISPAKTLDYDSAPPTDSCTTPDFLDRSKELIKQLRTLSEEEIAALMSISPKLAILNHERYRDWKPPFNADNAKQALFAFKGDVYTGFDLSAYEEKDFGYAQDHLRILSGLYGLLRPLDLMQPYRLEMGTKLENKRGKDLYEFWGNTITEALNEAIAESGTKVLVNLASNEYYHSVKPDLTGCPDHHSGVQRREKREAQDHQFLCQKGPRSHVGLPDPKPDRKA